MVNVIGEITVYEEIFNKDKRRAVVSGDRDRLYMA